MKKYQKYRSELDLFNLISDRSRPLLKKLNKNNKIDRQKIIVENLIMNWELWI